MSVEQLAYVRWGVRPKPASARFEEPGWSYGENVAVTCPECGGGLFSFRKPYVSAGKEYQHVALICRACPASFTLGDVGLKRYREALERRPRPRPAVAAPSFSPPWEERDDPGRQGLRVTAIHEGRLDEYVRSLLGRSGTRVVASDDRALDLTGQIEAREDRLLRWVKLNDPHEPVPQGGPGLDVRVLLPDDDSFGPVREKLERQGVPFRAVRYWLEGETVTSVDEYGGHARLTASARLNVLGNGHGAGLHPVTSEGLAAAAARDAFQVIWDAHEHEVAPPVLVPAAAHVPAAWLPYLPFPSLNPAQAQASPRLRDGDGHLLVTAPTGAGKTVIGMIAALRTILAEGRKAAWLVPQRSLTDELDRELQTWRDRGLRVERLSGEYATDVERIRDADLWVATTEKFESLCRASSMREAIAEVGCLIVDEVHLLGSPGRGPVLEALLARVRGFGSPVRIVGLSATVANAEEIAGWLGAEPVAIEWRPTRLTWQLLTIPAGSDRAAAQAARTRLTCRITRRVTRDDGSVLVFCGSRRGVRLTALAIAADRGADISRVDPDDMDRVHEVCAAAGIGLHYKDWEHKRETERAFRAREIDVLVATTTVAAGVNLPARAVVVRDTTLGRDKVDVAQIQQMFGRAGRIGAGETEGWAYLIVDENERPSWQARLVDGYQVSSKIVSTLADHVLAEAVQGRVATLREAEAWWIQTLAHYQGVHSLEPLNDAVDALVDGDYITTAPPAGLSDLPRADTADDPDEVDDADITVTDLGLLTARLMVSTQTGHELREELEQAPVPPGHLQAETLLISLLSVLVGGLADAPVTDEVRPAVARLLQARGRLDRIGSARAFTRGGLAGQAPYAPGDLAKATLLTAVNSPGAFTGRRRTIAGIPATAMYPILDEAPHYLNWLAGQGYLGTVHPWAAVVAADLARRIRWRRLAPPRGAGRLLWMCEQMATPLHAETAVPQMWQAATRRGVDNPDWPAGAPPTGCRLDTAGYRTLLRDRLTGAALTLSPGHALVNAAPGTVATTWNGRARTRARVEADQLPLLVPAAAPEDDPAPGAALFSRRGDYQATGWLSVYHRMGATPATPTDQTTP
ncbi:DEAD/DEAH box helicase [Actinomadura roseirufa]|uniref:DEAD/DEAH box helicase n=1 Tax=Actinomadura roseirufa TaxID=2094049 RepID=UPI001041AC5A|nr:DEAD/DEAH box helicase [Actinomadura roseirufa]